MLLVVAMLFGTIATGAATRVFAEGTEASDQPLFGELDSYDETEEDESNDDTDDLSLLSLSSLEAATEWTVAADGDAACTNQVCDTIGAAVAKAEDGDTIVVSAGTYTEQIVITKSISLRGSEGNVVIKAPDAATMATFQLDETGTRKWRPVIFAYGDNEPIEVSISGFTIDASDFDPPSDGGAGILLDNVRTGEVTGNSVTMYPSTKATFGIVVYGNSDVTIDNNVVSGASRLGIGGLGDDRVSATQPHVTITNNTVTPPAPPDEYKSSWAPNGIQIGWGATGSIIGNTVSGQVYAGANWASSGIIVAASDDVIISGNTVLDNQLGISVLGDAYFGTGHTATGTKITGNTLEGNEWAIALENGAVDTVIRNNVISNSVESGVSLAFFPMYALSAPAGTKIEANTFTDNPIAIEDSSSENTEIVNNDITRGHQGIAVIPDSATENITITNNRLRDIGLGRSDGIGINVGAHVTATINGNTIDGYGKAGIIVGSVTYGGADTSAIVVGNTITGSGESNIAQNGIQIGQGATATVSGNTVQNNICIANSCKREFDKDNADGATGILVYAPSDTEKVTIANNQLFSNQVGVWTVAAKEIEVRGNTITGPGSDYPSAGVAVWTADQWTESFAQQHPQGTEGSITRNRISNVDYGLHIRDYAPNGHHFNNLRAFENAITGSLKADAWSDAKFDARYNWWGSASGPANIEGKVEYDPWLTRSPFAVPIPPGDESTLTPPAPAAGSGTVDPETGGTVASEDGSLEIAVPAGAVDTEVTFSVEPVAANDTPPTAAGMFMIGNQVYQIEATDANGAPVRQFGSNITLTFQYDPAGLGDFDAADVQVYYWDEDLEAWIAIPTRVNADGTVTAFVDHLTVFALMASKDAPRFSDIVGHWGEADILKLASLGIISGVGGGKFDSEGTVTRAQFARMIVGAMGLGETDADLSFTDAALIPAWAAGYVATAVAEGIIHGLDDGSFAPNAHITREQIAVMIARALKLPLAGESSFADNAAISAWARGAVKSVADAGIVGGVGGNRFAPADKATRAQAARMLSRLLTLRFAR